MSKRTYLTDCRTDNVIREATPADLVAARGARDHLVRYLDHHDNVREGYLVRYESDEEGVEYTVPLDDSEIDALAIDALAGGRS